MWHNPSARAAVDCGEMDLGDVREEIMVGNACGGKPGSRGRYNTAESCIGGGAINCRLHRPTRQHPQLNSIVRPIKDLMDGTTE